MKCTLYALLIHGKINKNSKNSFQLIIKNLLRKYLITLLEQNMDTQNIPDVYITNMVTTYSMFC